MNQMTWVIGSFYSMVKFDQFIAIERERERERLTILYSMVEFDQFIALERERLGSFLLFL